MARQRWRPTPRRVNVTQPGAGANFSRVNDSGGLWVIRGLAFTLTTSAAVANRVMTLLARAAEDVWFRTSAGGVQVASLTFDYSGWPGSGSPSGTTPVALLGWPHDGLWLPPGQVIESDVQAIDAADQISAVVLDVIEYPETLPTHLTPGPTTYENEDQE
jgi:hypothetical protein